MTLPQLRQQLAAVRLDLAIVRAHHNDVTRRIAELADEALVLQAAVLLAERDERGEWAMVDSDAVAFG